MSDECSKLGIPAYLHQGDRNADQNFDPEELLYRRFFTKIPSSEWQQNKSVSVALFELKDDSYNRSRYSQEPEDVLYNERKEDNGNHYFDAGILQVAILHTLEFSFDINGNERAFRLSPFHKPTECIFPHTELHIYENETKIDYTQSKPKSLKAAIRDFLVRNCIVIKECAA